MERFNNGIRVEENARATVRDTVVAGNSSGLVTLPAADQTAAEMNVENCVVTNNLGEALVAGGIGEGFSSVIRVSNTTITNNGIGLQPQGGQIITRGNNTIEGNSLNGTFSGTFAAK